MAKTVGLTGGIGSGKSYICRIFKMMGVPIYNSDEEARRLMVENKELRTELTKILGKLAFNKDGTLNKAHIASQIFSDEKKLSAVNAVVHPAVRTEFKKFAKQNKKRRYVINEAALFVENSTYKDFDYLISVVSPLELRIERTMSRDGSTRKEILARISKQSTDAEKIRVSNYVIYNDSFSNLFLQISEIHSTLRQL